MQIIDQASDNWLIYHHLRSTRPNFANGAGFAVPGTASRRREGSYPVKRIRNFGLQGIGFLASWLVVLLGCAFGVCAVPVLLLSLFWLD